MQNLYSVKSHDETNMKAFVLSLWEKLSWGLTYFDEFINLCNIKYHMYDKTEKCDFSTLRMPAVCVFNITTLTFAMWVNVELLLLI